MYKLLYVMEEYLVKLPKKNMIMLSKLRACDNKLSVIEGRHRNICREERVCNVCEGNFVGDEFLFFSVIFCFLCLIRVGENGGCSICSC